MSPDKVPVMVRLSRRLERHGLSFGDALNVALFILTVASLFLAYQGVRLARVTLEDARTQAAKASQDSAQASQNQDAQFKEQMKQLSTSSDALEKTSTLLKSQSDILRRLQQTSEQQLTDLNNAEKRYQKQENAKPKPAIQINCNGDREPLLSVSAEDITRSAGQPLKYTTPYPHPPIDHRLYCALFLGNSGDTDLKNVKLRIYVFPEDSYAPPGDTVIITDLSGSASNEFERTIFDGITIHPKVSSNQMASGWFALVLCDNCKQFSLRIFLDSDNSNAVLILESVTIDEPPPSESTPR